MHLNKYFQFYSRIVIHYKNLDRHCALIYMMAFKFHKWNNFQTGMALLCLDSFEANCRCCLVRTLGVSNTSFFFFFNSSIFLFSPPQNCMWDHREICRSFSKPETDLCLWRCDTVGGERQTDSRERSQQGQHRTPSSTPMNSEHKEVVLLNGALILRNTEDEKSKTTGNYNNQRIITFFFFWRESNSFLSAVVSFLGFENIIKAVQRGWSHLGFTNA